MADDSTFAGSIPDIYDNCLVPLIFESYARDLALRLAAIKPENILEVAAGTGVVTRAMATALSESRIVATDLNQPMLDRAASRQMENARLSWRQADALALPFENQTFDAVVCQFGAMFFPDKVKAYREARRVLTARGLFLFNVWDEISHNEFADTVTEALVTMFPDDPPMFMARTPHGYHDSAEIAAQLRQAGFGTVQIERVEARSRADTPRDVAIAYCQGTPLRNEIMDRNPSALNAATELADVAIAKRFGDGPLSGKICALVVMASP